MRAEKFPLPVTGVRVIRDRMTQMGLKEKELAAQLGLSENHVYRVLQRADGVSVPLVIRLAETLEVTTDDLVREGGSASPTAPPGLAIVRAVMDSAERRLAQKIDGLADALKRQAEELDTMTRLFLAEVEREPDENPPDTDGAVPPTDPDSSGDKPPSKPQ